MGWWIRGRWICVWGAPDFFAPNRSQNLQNKGFGGSGLKVGAPKKRRSNDQGSIERPILGPLN